LVESLHVRGLRRLQGFLGLECRYIAGAEHGASILIRNVHYFKYILVIIIY
jgi:hypothetical protein